MPKLQDTINKDFNINNFIDLSEAEDFIENLPLVKDIVMTIKDVFKVFGDLYNVVKQIINAVLNYIKELLALFDNLGITDLIDKLFGFLSSLFTGFGLTIKDTNNLENMFVTSCNYYNENLNSKYKMNLDMFSFGLIAILQALLCLGTPGSLTSLYNTFDSNENMTTEDVNEIFGNTLPYILKDNSNINSISFLNEMTTLNLDKSIISYVPNFSEQALNYINNDTSGYDFNYVKDTISSVDPSFNDINNVAIFKDKTKFKELAQRSLNGKVPDFNDVSEVAYETLVLI